MTLSDAVAAPCKECPWRREAAPGWLGPGTSEEWIATAHSEAAIACHMTIPKGEGGKWVEGMRQCRGAAIFRENVFKMPRDREIVVGPRDTKRVFGSNAEFLEHHTREIP